MEMKAVMATETRIIKVEAWNVGVAEEIVGIVETAGTVETEDTKIRRVVVVVSEAGAGVASEVEVAAATTSITVVVTSAVTRISTIITTTAMETAKINMTKTTSKNLMAPTTTKKTTMMTRT